jgi:CheY-like chemotaxis protein
MHGMDVLVVESDGPLRAVVATWLRRRGLEVGEAASGETALDMAATSTSPPVVVTDAWFGAGHMTGFAFGEAVRRRWPGIGIVYLTGHAHPPRDAPGPHERCLPAPFPLSVLLHAIRDVAPGGRTMGHEATGMEYGAADHPVPPPFL